MLQCEGSEISWDTSPSRFHCVSDNRVLQRGHPYTADSAPAIAFRWSFWASFPHRKRLPPAGEHFSFRNPPRRRIPRTTSGPPTLCVSATPIPEFTYALLRFSFPAIRFKRVICYKLKLSYGTKDVVFWPPVGGVERLSLGLKPLR